MDPTMDLLRGVKENMKGVGDVGAELGGVGGDAGGSGGFEMPSMEKLMEMIEGMDMSAEEKAQIKENLMGKGDILSKMGQYQNTIPSPVGGEMNPNTAYLVFLAAVIIVTFILVFFGYKLYKSLIEKERKREEKRKLKQQKKKK